MGLFDDLLSGASDLAGTAADVADSYQTVRDDVNGVQAPVTAPPASIPAPNTSVTRKLPPPPLAGQPVIIPWINAHRTGLLWTAGGLTVGLILKKIFKW